MTSDQRDGEEELQPGRHEVQPRSDAHMTWEEASLPTGDVSDRNAEEPFHQDAELSLKKMPLLFKATE